MKALRARAEAERLGGVGLAGTALLHALLAAGVIAGARRPDTRTLLPAYRVELLAAPRPVPAQAESPAEAPAEQPAVPASAQPLTPPVSPTRPSPSPTRPIATPPTRTPAAPATVTRPATAEPAAPAAPNPAEPGPTGTGGTGREAATIRTEGVEFPFPGYLRNLVSQVYRRWRSPGGNSTLEAEIFFFVNRDGSVSGIQFIRRSGSFAFDLEAQGAIEAAARAEAFGDLPAGYAADVLPVSFFFSPRTAR